MSRSGYSDDLSQSELAMWRGMVTSATRGKRGQALLKELESALVALPRKELCAHEFANAEDGQVCALGAVALQRRTSKGMSLVDALKEIEKEYPEGCAAEEAADEFNIADCLLQEITFVNDERGRYDETTTQRYERVLKWVRDHIKK